MIKINRGPAPEFMDSPIIRETKEKIENHAKKSDNQDRFHFDRSILQPVIEDLRKIFQDKCCYCETKLEEQNSFHTSTFRPLEGARGLQDSYFPNHYWWLAYEWDNLLIACPICDQKLKRDYFPIEDENLRCKIGAYGKELLAEKPLIIDPCYDDPFEHLRFDDKGKVCSLTRKGHTTIEILSLNRIELIRKRQSALQRLKTRLNNLEQYALNNVQLSNNRSTHSLIESIEELFSAYPTQECVAAQITAFLDWHTKNKDLWNELLRINNLNPNINYNLLLKNKRKRKYTSKSNAALILSNLKRFSIKSVEIENFKSIENLAFDIKPTEENSQNERWLLLLGDNGIGKSSILQAITLALSSKNQLQKLKLNVLDYLRYGTEKGKVIIHSYENKTPIVLWFNKEGFHTNIEEPPTFVLAYGSTRLLPKGPLKPDKNKEPYQNVSNLFDYSVALSDPNKWLTKVSEEEFNNRIAPAFFDILALRGKDKIMIKNKKIHIQQYNSDYELEDNSDGFKTVMALVSDIMQTLSLDKANYHNSQGIVLIDEIGNHLHPRWRMKIAKALRKAFPSIQFIVTTHEPLCLRGLSHGEVAVLVRDNENKIRILQSDLLPDHSMMRIDQLLTSDLFGLINVQDDDAEKTYEEYYTLLSKNDKTADDKSKIEELHTKISGNEVLGEDLRQQVFFELIDKTIADKIREEGGYKSQVELKEETIGEVKEILKNSSINWL